jgi:DNA-binding PadR family transcriptional regulator
MAIKHPTSLTESTFHILLALSGSEKHGYGIMVEVATQTNGSVSLGPGTLYGCLKRLLDAGWITEIDRSDFAADEREGTGFEGRRRYYRLTGQGADVLDAELRRIQAITQLPTVRRILGGQV